MASGVHSARKAAQTERAAASGAVSSREGWSASQRLQHPLNEVPEVHDIEELLQIARGHGSLVAYASPERKWTYTQLCDDVDCLTRSLRDVLPVGAADAPQVGEAQTAELRTGTLFRLRVRSPYLFCVAFLAVVRVGGVAVLGEGELGSGATAIPLDDKDVGRLIRVDPGPHPCAATLHRVPLDPDAPCAIAFSSGTTSVAKGVVLSQCNLLSDARGGMAHYRFTQDDRYVAVIPRTHLFGLVADMLAPLIAGGRVCFSTNSLAFFADLVRFRPTSLSLPPALVSSMVRLCRGGMAPEQITGGALERVMCAGADVPEELISSMEGLTGVRVRPAYGLTECSPCVSLTQDWQRVSGSVGAVIPCCEVGIEDGEVLVRGANVMLGYYHAPEETGRVMRDGWLHTGDLGRVDERGNLFLTGRRSSLIVFEDGRKLMPEVLEARLQGVPDVVEALVLPSRCDGRMRYRVTVHVAAEANEPQVEGYVRDCCREVGFGELLAGVEFTRQPLPRTALGKLIRR